MCGSFNRNLDLCEESMSEAASNVMELGGSCNYSLVNFIPKSAAKSLFNALDTKKLDDILID